LAESPFFEQELAALRVQHEGWLQASSRGNHSLWDLLGLIFELGSKVQENASARSDLIRRVEADSDVAKSNRWQAKDKSAFELLIVVLVGFHDGNKGTRSQWLSALKAAKKANIPRAKTPFVDWIKDLGGVDAARRSLAKGPANEGNETLASQLDGFVDQDRSAFSLPDRFSDQGFAEGFGLVLVKKVGEGEAVPVATIENERQVTVAIKTFLSAQKRRERGEWKAYEAEVLGVQRQRRAKVRRLYRDAIKAKRTTAEFDEFLWEWETANLLAPAELATRITEP
jgi:hypothetical protein